MLLFTTSVDVYNMHVLCESEINNLTSSKKIMTKVAVQRSDKL